MGRVPQIVLHVGAHKTASTHLQKSLKRADATLRDAGVVVLGPDALRNDVFRLSDIMGFDGPMSVLRETVAESLAALAGGAQRIVISEENILGVVQQRDMPRSGRFYPRGQARVAHLVDALGGAVQLAIAVRDPADFLTSAYSQRLFAGHVEGFDAYVGNCNPAQMRWSTLIAEVADVPGVTATTVWRYEDYAAQRSAILEALVGEGPTAAVRDIGKRVHAGLSAAAYEQISRELAAGRTVDRTRVKALKDQFPKTTGADGFDPWMADVRSDSAAAYRNDIGRIAAIPGVTVIGGDTTA